MLGDLNIKVGREDIFINQTFGIKVYMRLVAIMELG
jgi:hypothetical protein